MPRKALRPWLPLALALVAYALWTTPLLFPLRMFVVFLHELSHGLAAVLTGGQIVRIELSPAEGGVCLTRGGWRFLVLSAGYLGSLAWGVALLLGGARRRGHGALLAGVGLLLLAVTLVYVRSVFGLVYGVLSGAALLLAARKLPEAASQVLLTMLGVVSCLYAVWDIVSDTLLRQIPASDASALGRLTGIPGPLWGVVWITLALATTVWALRSGWR
ncbi:MAG TPA: M50 family metallopeptidase [Vicinamibacteria bacterium]|nr:M50 family metallopeptidase [Vicinamibacteria bacterium]